MVYLKENIKDLLLFLDELNIYNYNCYNQKKYIIKVLVGKGSHSEDVIVCVTSKREQVKLNDYLRKRLNKYECDEYGG